MSKFGDAMRGLTVFISDIRNCKSKEAERKRINKELANIRSKFKSDKNDGYQKKKYVCKLLFIFLLGNDINFGYQEAVNLLSSIRFSEKQIGYLFVTVLMSEGHELMPLVIQAIRHDLESRNPIFNTLAMQCVANVASREMAEQLGKDVIPNILTSPDTNLAVRQTACLCLLKLIRVDHKIITLESHSSRIVKFLNDRHLGLVTAACSLLEELAHTQRKTFQVCVPDVIQKLAGIVGKNHADLQDYSYYFVPAPWLCVKLMKILECYPIPEDPIVKARLVEAMETILNKASEPSKSKKVQHSNAKNAVLFEAINLIVHMDSEPNLQVKATNLLGGYLTHKETNMRFLSIEGLCNLSLTEFSREAVRKHQDTVLNTLKTERDVSVRQKAIDLLYAMCDHSNAQTIVQELLQYLEKADYSIREALVLKIAILSEKYAHDYTWYVDTILNLIRLAGDYISEEVWYRIIQIVVNKKEVQGYAAKTCFEALQAPACHENMIKVGGYILGEFGNLIAGDPRSSALIQFQLLHSKFPFCSLSTRSLLLSTYVKFINLYPEIKGHIQTIFEQDGQSRNSDLELQQRSIEYLKLSHKADPDVMATIFEVMPLFPEKDSLLLSKLYQTAPWMAKLHESPETHRREEEAEPAPPQPAPLTAAGGDPSDPIYAQVNKPKPSQAPLISTAPSAVTTPPTATPPVTTPPMNEFSLIDVTAPVAAAPVALKTEAPPALKTEAPPALKTEAPPTLQPEAEESFKRFVAKNSGVLYENHALQIGVKSEFNGSLARFGIFFGNKSNSSLANFSTEITIPPESKTGLSLDYKPVPGTIDAGAQVQQIINVECLGVFLEAPVMKVSFSTGGAPNQFLIKIPLMLHKFSEKAVMDSATFFNRWKQLANPAQECQKIFTAAQPMEKETAAAKLTGFGITILDGIDPNPDNVVGACIVKTKSVLVGCLLRLEPNHQTKQYRLTLRTSHESVSQHFNTLISELL